MNSATCTIIFLTWIVLVIGEGNTGVAKKGEEDIAIDNGSNAAPVTLSDGRSRPRSQLDMGLRKPLISFKSLVALKKDGFEMEKLDEATGLISFKRSNMSNQPTPTEPNSLKNNTTNATLKTVADFNEQKDFQCPTFETMINGSLQIWSKLKDARGIKEGAAIVVNATKLTFESIEECISLIFAKMGDLVRGSTTVSLSPAVTTPQSTEKRVPNKSKGVGPRFGGKT